MNYILRKADTKEEIENVKNLEYEDNVDKIFLSFGFTTPTVLRCGDKVELYNTADDVIVFRGVITTVNQSKEKEFDYSGYDVGFYLQKNELTTQYKNNTFEYILKDVCKKCELEVGQFPDINKAKYTHIYRKTTAEDILKDAYDNAVKNGIENKYFFDCKDGKISLKPYEESEDMRGVISLMGQIDTFEYIKDFNISKSIVDLKNYVEIFTDNSVNNKNTDKPDGLAKDDTSINTYGLLRYAQDLDKDTTQNPQTVANTVLKELNKVDNIITMTVFGNYKLHKGLVTTIESDKIGLNGQYKLLSSRHSIHAIDEEVRIKVEKQ